MAYPTVDAPYGLKPINLIGGQVFAGSTRNLPIQYNYGTSIYYGDVVGLVRGFAARLAVTDGSTNPKGAPGSGLVGVFLGCSFTDPVTKQKRFSQYWPANTLAGDAVAIVTDDPDTIFKMAVCSSGTTMASAANAMVGQNLAILDNTGSANTGNSAIAAQAPATAAAAQTAAYPLRVVGVVPDTAVTLGTAVWSSGTTTLTTTANVGFAVPVGTDVSFLAANGQSIGSGSWVITAIAANNTTSVVLSAQYGVVGAGGTAATGTAVPSASTIVFNKYPEVLVKLNFSNHEYYYATPF
jgi:hypothetical protein